MFSWLIFWSMVVSKMAEQYENGINQQQGHYFLQSVQDESL